VSGGKRRGGLLFVQSTTEVGGAETVLLNLLAINSELRERSVVATLSFGNGNLPERLRGVGAEVVELQAGRLRSPVSVLGAVAKLALLASRRRVGAVVGNGAHPQVFASLAARVCGARSVYLVHSYYADPSRMGRIDRLALRLPCNLLIANSEATARALERVRPSGKRVVVYPGVPGVRLGRSAAVATRTRWGIQEDEVVFGVFSRFQRGKGQDIYLEAAARVMGRLPRTRFLVVGGSTFGLEREYGVGLREQANRLGLKKAVIFTGQQSEVAHLMAACDVVCLPSRDPESFGMVAAEAMAQARPVVATRCGGPEEVVVDGETGYLVAPGSVEALAVAMGALAIDRAKALRMGEAGRVRMERLFTSETMARNFLAEVEAA
jgi:glycosyltransferase involved in cell wall biosynthesis